MMQAGGGHDHSTHEPVGNDMNQHLDQDLDGHLATERLFGLDFVSNATIGDVVDLLLDDLAGRSGFHSVVTPNVDHLVRYRDHAAEAEVARQATIVLPDGMPIVWSSRLLGRPLRRRLAGSDLFVQLWPRVVDESIPFAVISPSRDVSAALRAEHDGCHCIEPPMFDADDQDANERIADEVDVIVAEHAPSFLVIALSQPKTHSLAAELRRRWTDSPVETPVVLLIGAAPEFHLGLRRRAPRWMRRSGLEWLHRLAGDPRRMARRYFVDDRAFVPIVWREFRSRR